MRITGGQASRRRLSVPRGLDVRPTPDRVKQAIFNSLGDRVAGARVLELYAGSGALSLECLSRGAATVLCIERSFKHGEYIRQNAIASGLAGDRFQLRVQDAFPAVRQLVAEEMLFDLVLADPPYGAKNRGKRSDSLAQATLDDESLPRLLAPGALLVLGHARRDTLTVPDAWHEVRALKHGDNVIQFLRPSAHGEG